MRLALGTVVELILTQLFLTGKGLQAAIQADGLSLGPSRLLHAAVFLHDLRGQNGGQDVFRPFCSLSKGQHFHNQDQLQLQRHSENTLMSVKHQRPPVILINTNTLQRDEAYTR